MSSLVRFGSLFARGALIAMLVVGAVTSAPGDAPVPTGNAVTHCDVDHDPTCPPELDIQIPGEPVDISTP